MTQQAPIRLCRVPRCNHRVAAYDHHAGSPWVCAKHEPVERAAVRAGVRTVAVGAKQMLRRKFPKFNRFLKALDKELEAERKQQEEPETIEVEAEVIR